MAIRRRSADPRPSCRLGQGEAFRPLLGHQRQRGAGQRPLEITVVIALTLRLAFRCMLTTLTSSPMLMLFTSVERSRNDHHIRDHSYDRPRRRPRPREDRLTTGSGTRTGLSASWTSTRNECNACSRRPPSGSYGNCCATCRSTASGAPIRVVAPLKAAAARRGVNIHFIAYLAMATVVVIVWATVAATSGASYFWPIWPLLGGAVGLFSHAFSVPSFRHNA